MLMQLIQQYDDGNKTRFAKRLGLTPQGISTWLSRGTIDHELVYSKCEGLNASWLLTGEGPMLCKDEVQQSIVATPSSDAVTLRLMDKLDEKDSLLKDKDTKIDLLQSELRQQSAELATLKVQLSQNEAIPLIVPHKENSKDLGHAKDVSTKKHSSPDADSATSAIAQ